MLKHKNNISKRKRAEKKVQQAHDDLGRTVKERTAELEQANERLRQEIEERKKAEKALRKNGERYALATKAAKVGVWDWNIQTNDFYLDPNVKAILGYRDVEIPNDLEVWSNYVHPDDKLPAMEAFQEHIDGKTPEYAYKHRMLHKDGSIRWIMARGIAMRDDRGNPVRIVGTDTDITQHQQAEEALRQSEEKFRALAEAAPAAIIILADEGFIYVNSAFESISGFTKEEAIGIQFWEMVHPDMREFVKSRGLARQRGETVPARYEIKALTKGGQKRWFDVAAASINYGGKTATLAIAYDIDDRKRAEEALREKDTKLEGQAKNLKEMNIALKILLEQREKEKMEIKENLLADINKLVYPYIEKLENTNLNPDAQTFVNIIKSNIDDLIAPFVTTLSSKYYSLTPSEIQIADLIKHGKTSKEIASILNVSPKAISFHRGNLRKKLGLLNKKINLRTYLQTFQN